MSQRGRDNNGTRRWFRGNDLECRKTKKWELGTAKRFWRWVRRTGKYLRGIAEGEHVQNVAGAIFEKIHWQDIVPVSVS